MIVTVWLLSALISIPPLLGWKQDPDLSWFYSIKTEKEQLNLTSREFGEYLSRELSTDEFENFTKTLADIVFPKCQVSDEGGYVVYSAFGSFYMPSCIMVFVYIKIYFAARARARRHIKPKLSPTRLETIKDYNIQLRSGNLNPWRQRNASQGVSSTAKVYSDDPALIQGKPKQILIGNPDDLERHQIKTCIHHPPNQEVPVITNGERSDTWEQPEMEMRNCCCAENGGYGLNGGYPRESRHFSGDEGGNADLDNRETSSPDSSFERCAPIRPGNIFHKLKLGRRLSKEAREMIDIGKVITVSRPDNPVPQTNIEREKRKVARAKERRATLILGLIMGSFIACWLPFFILYIIGPQCPVCGPKQEQSCCVPGRVFSFAFWLGYSNSALNPVIYTVFNKDFRKAFKKILFK